MSKPHPFQPQRHPSGRGYEVIDHRDMSLHGHWSCEEVAAMMATTWNMRELSQERDDLLAALRTIANIALMDKGHWAKTIECEALAAIAKAGGA